MQPSRHLTRAVTLALSAGALLSLAACVTTRSTLASSAENLEHSAHELARDEPVGSDYPTYYARDARELADEARDFRHTVEDRSASREDVRVEFKHVSHTYHALRDEVEHSDSRTARADLRPVTDAYLDVERAMGGYPTGADDVSRR